MSLQDNLNAEAEFIAQVIDEERFTDVVACAKCGMNCLIDWNTRETKCKTCEAEFIAAVVAELEAEKTYTNPEQLREAAFAADKAYGDALREAYGKDAGDMRYAKVLPSQLAILRIAKREADDAWLACIRQHRL